LASEPRVSHEEWNLIVHAINALSADVADAVRRRILDGAGRARPVVCPMLDTDAGACLIYEARPIACRTYGFYAERGDVLGCFRIEALSKESTEVVWGNHDAVEADLREIGPARPLSVWLEGEGWGRGL
jgi:uncharacterized protein